MKNDNPHVLITSHTLEYRGLGISSYNLTYGLHQNDFDVTVLAPPGPLKKRMEDMAVTYLPCHFFQQPELEIFKIDTLIEGLKNRGIDLVHNYSLKLHPLISRMAQKMGIPYFLTIHSFTPEQKRVHTSFPKFQSVIVPADAMREHVVNELDVQKDDVQIIPTGIDVDARSFHEILQPDAQPVIGMSSPLVHENDLSLLPDIARYVLDRKEDIQFLILGQGEEELNLRKKLQEIGIRKSFTFLDNPYLYYRMFDNIDLLLHPDPRIGLGVRILEAMACGIPPVARGGGGIYQTIDNGETGYILSVDESSEQIGDTLLELIDTPEKAREFGKKGRKHVEEKFTLRNMIQEMIWLYESVL